MNGRAVRRWLVPVAVLLVAAVAVAATGASAVQTGGNATLVYEGDRLTLENATGQAVYGRTDLPPGSTVSVRLYSTGSSPFLRSTTATVTASGRFRSTFDLASVDPGTEFTARVFANGTELTSAPGVVTACTGDCPPPVAEAAPATPEATLAPVGNLTLAAGLGQAVRGRSNLPPGSRLTVEFRGIDGRLPPLETRAVGDDRGRFLAVADLSGVPAGTDLRVSVRYLGVRLAERRVTVLKCDRDCQPARRTAAANGTLFAGLNGTTRPRVLETVRGRRVRLPLSLGDSRTATLSVGGPAGRYALDVVVRDGDGDRRVGLVFDTGNATDPGRAVRVVDDADAVTVERAPDRTDRDGLDAGEYPLALYRGADTEPLVGLLVVRPAEGGSGGAAVTRFAVRRTPLTTRKGRTARVPVTLDETSAATLVVNGSDYALRATVRDGSGDERVVLAFNTSATAAPRLRTVDGADAVTVHSENGSVAPGEYWLTLYRGPDATDGGATPPDLWSADGTLIVAERPSTPSAGSGTPIDGISLPALGALGLGGLLAVAGLAFLTGAIEP